MNKEEAFLGGGILSTLYSWLGPATEIIQFSAAILGVIALVLSIWLYILKIRNANNNSKMGD